MDIYRHLLLLMVVFVLMFISVNSMDMYDEPGFNSCLGDCNAWFGFDGSFVDPVMHKRCANNCVKKYVIGYNRGI